MKANALPLTKLYDTLNKAYIIPSYQRPFSWSPEKATDLLEAIFEDAKSGANLTSIGTFLFCNVPYAVGANPFGNNTIHSNAPNTIWEVVDGQQRLTSLAMIGFALHSRLQLLSATGFNYSPSLEFEQFFRTSRTMRGQGVPALIRDGDNFDTGYCSEISLLLNIFISNQTPPPEQTRLREALKAIQDWVDSKLDSTNFGDFSDYFLMKCQYIQVEADDQDSAFSMFEPLNSTSEPLTAFEVYRSKVTRAFPAISEFPLTLELLDYDKASRDQVVKNSNTLIFSVAQTYSGLRPRIHFVQLKRYLDENISQNFVVQFELGAEFLHQVWNNQILIQPWFDAETKDCIKFLRAANHDACLPLLMRYYQTSPAYIPDIVKVIVAFFALWRPVFPTNSLPDIYRNLFTEAKPDNMAHDGGTLKSVNELKAYFRGKLEARLGNLTGVQTYMDVWLDPNNQIYLTYVQLKTLCRLYVLIDMGSSLKANLIPDDPWTEQDDIEHIWAISNTPTPQNLHKVGNLTFLPPAVNRSISDMDWIHKKEIYTHLASTQKSNHASTVFSDGTPLPDGISSYLANPSSLALAHLQTISQNSVWTEQEITTRTQTMLRNVWQTLYVSWLN